MALEPITSCCTRELSRKDPRRLADPGALKCLYLKTRCLYPRRGTGYEPGAVDRLKFIRGCQRLGLRLREIADLLAVRDTGVCPCEPAERLLRRRLGEIDAELARLTALRSEIVAMADALLSAQCPPPPPGTWRPPQEGVIGGDVPAVVLLRRPELPARLRLRLLTGTW